MTKIFFETEDAPGSEQFCELIEYAINGALSYVGFERECSVSVTLTDNSRIAELNRDYRGIDRATDVLSFPMYTFADGDEPPEEGDISLGDVVISVERAASQAEEYGHSLKREIAFLTVHSILHLLGWDHELSENAEREMFALQDRIMDELKISRDD